MEDNFQKKIIKTLKNKEFEFEYDANWYKAKLKDEACDAKKDFEDLANQILQATDQEIKDRLRRIGAGTTNCKKCNEEIIFIRTKMGNLMPVCLNLISHFANCPGASEFRKRSNNKTLNKKSMNPETITEKLQEIDTLVNEIKEKADRIQKLKGQIAEEIKPESPPESPEN